MTGVYAATEVEWRKAWASPVVRTASVLLVVGTTVLASAMTVAARRGNEEIIAQLGPLADAAGWELYLGIVMQVAAAAAVLGFGVTLSWVVGREFTDGTISALFALPVTRRQLCIGKFVVYGIWAIGVAVALALVLAVVGVMLGLGAVAAAVTGTLGRLLVLLALSSGLAVPAAWAATLGRGLLPGIAMTISIVIAAQVGAIAGAGAWLPLASPALWAFEPEQVSAVQLVLSLSVPMLFGLLTVRAWDKLQLDR